MIMKSDALQGLHHVNYKSAYFKSVFLASAPLIGGCIIWLWLTVNDDVGHDLGAWLDFAPSALASFLAIEIYIICSFFNIYWFNINE